MQGVRGDGWKFGRCDDDAVLPDDVGFKHGGDEMMTCNRQTMTDEMREETCKHLLQIQQHLPWKTERLNCEIINTAILGIYGILDMVHHNSNYPCPKEMHPEPLDPDALDILEAWDSFNNSHFLIPHPTVFDMIRLVREKPLDVVAHDKEQGWLK